MTEKAYFLALKAQDSIMRDFFKRVSAMWWKIHWSGSYCPDYETYLQAIIRESTSEEKKHAISALKEWQVKSGEEKRQFLSFWKKAQFRELEHDAKLHFGRKSAQVYPVFDIHFPARPPYLFYPVDLPAAVQFLFEPSGNWRGKEKTIDYPHLRQITRYWIPDIYSDTVVSHTKDMSQLPDIHILYNIRPIPNYDISSIRNDIKHFIKDLSQDPFRDLSQHPYPSFPWGVTWKHKFTDRYLLVYATKAVWDSSAPPPHDFRKLGRATGDIVFIGMVKKMPLQFRLHIDATEWGLGPNNYDMLSRMTEDIAHAMVCAFQVLPPYSRELDLSPLTSVNLNTSPGPNNICTLRVAVTDEKGKPVKGALVTLEKPKLGMLSSLKLVTDANGQATVIYTAPTEGEMEKLGKEEVEVVIKAKDEKSIATMSQTFVHVRSKHKAFATRIEYKILPAHPDYFNRISFAFRAANKPDASPYKALVTIQKGGYGALTKSNDDKGGTRKLELNVFPKKQYDFYYHWTGPAAMMKAYNEVVIIEIPELKLKRKVQFSVGIDLMIESVQMKYGNHVFPVMFEPFNIYIRDKFHPKADLVKIFKDFGINMDLKISQVAHVRVPPDPTQECILDALMTAWEGSSAYPHAEPIIYDGPMWGIKKTKNGRYIIWSTGKDSKGKTFVEYPGINVFERGTYQFEVKVSPGKFDADPRNNNAITDTIEIKDFPSEAGELLHTVFLPSAEFLVSLSSRFEIQFAYAVKDITLDLMQGDVKGAFRDLFINIWLHYCDVVRTDKLKKAEFFAKIGNTKLAKQLRHEANLLLAPTLAVYTKTLCDQLLKILYTNQSDRKLLPTFHLTSSAYADELSPKTFNESDVFKISQLTLKGAKDYYLVVINRGGIESLDAETSTGVKLRKAPSKISVKMKEDEIIFQGKNYIVIPVKKDEKIDLSLSGTGRSGKLTVITPDRITHYKYPSSKWKSILEVYPSGNITTKQGNEFEPINILKIAGTWKTSFGKMILTQHGNIVTGHYTHDNGKIVGFLKGNIFKGQWSEAPTYKPPHDAGDFRFIFSKNGKSFSGKWRYGHGRNGWKGDWQGHKIPQKDKR